MYSITIDVIRDDGSMGEMVITRDGIIGGQAIISFDDIGCKFVAIDLTDAIKFLVGGERGKLKAHELPKWERMEENHNKIWDGENWTILKSK